MAPDNEINRFDLTGRKLLATTHVLPKEKIEQEKNNKFGAGIYPVARGRGVQDCTGSIDLDLETRNIIINAFYPTGNINFYTLSTPSTPGTLLDQFDDVGFVSEVTDPKFTDPEYPLIYGKCIGGMLKDKDGFGQYTNYHEVLNNIAENFLYKGTQRYSFSGGTYGVEVSLGHMIPSTNSQFTVKQSTVYDTVKFKLFNDTLNTCKTVVSNIQGDRDTTEWTYSEQATSGDNSKDVKLLFHNLPILTNGNVINNPDFVANPPDRIRFESNKYYVRNTINSGSLCYLSEDGIVRKVDTKCEIAYRASGNLSKSLAIDRLQSFVQQVITEQP